MLEVPLKSLKSPKDSSYYHSQPSYVGKESNLGLPKRKFPATRKFKFAVPNLRYGSGVRFELSNDPKTEGIPWSFKFFYGNSKNIKEVPLNNEVKQSLSPVLNSTKNEVFNQSIDKIVSTYADYKSKKLQKLWTASELNNDVFNFLDEVGECVEQILDEANLENLDSNLLTAITQESNKKIEENKKSILTGFYFLSTLNSRIFNK
jgi:DNA (cytosine-5)-methyltransferase 1